MGENRLESMRLAMAELPNRPPPDAGADAESTFQLLERAHAGDRTALDVLFARYLKPLQHWVSGRLPAYARSAVDTHDLVQDALLNTFKRIGHFEPRREGAFLAYLRQVVMNRIREEIRKVRTRPVMATFDELDHEHDGLPLDDVIGLETLERYETALARLSPGEREAIVGRIEFGHSYAELARHLDKPSADAARMAVARALEHLAEEMGR